MSWLLQMEENVLKRRQELPDNAFVSAEELRDVWEDGRRGGPDRALPIVAVSACWDTREHPDPTGRQLKMIVDTLKSERTKYCQRWFLFGGFSEMGVFWDWPSLLQGNTQRSIAARQAALAEHKTEQEAVAAASDAERTPSEKAAFGYALHQTMDLWYAHQGTTVLLVTQHPRERGSQREQGYEESGWATYERCSAEQIKTGNRLVAKWDSVLDLGSSTCSVKAVGRCWPVGPQAFDGLIQTKSFTNSADRTAVKELYRKMSTAHLGSVREISQGCRAQSPPT
ncbi:unnamed protein product [Prorocentrum cordatum]|uniref:Uncharacterized protein n=1 Tax=Prorocentrum cordatum TaxID=2364126 RepID=A0ABN9XII6_9DINO|nr:unnamed protein product [Polarella glacialis]